VLVSRLAFRKVPTKVPTNCWYLVVLECIALDVVYKKKPRITGLLGLHGIWWDYCLVAMGGLEPPTPA
ncbi:uncharacterized protein METZ01_LOCUS161872, partial [marine metagenome]